MTMLWALPSVPDLHDSRSLYHQSVKVPRGVPQPVQGLPGANPQSPEFRGRVETLQPEDAIRRGRIRRRKAQSRLPPLCSKNAARRQAAVAAADGGQKPEGAHGPSS